MQKSLVLFLQFVDVLEDREMRADELACIRHAFQSCTVQLSTRRLLQLHLLRGTQGAQPLVSCLHFDKKNFYLSAQIPRLLTQQIGFTVETL